MSEDRVKDYLACNKWMRAVEDWMKAGAADPTRPPPAPVDAIVSPHAAFGGASPYMLALAIELRQTRAERDHARALVAENDAHTAEHQRRQAATVLVRYGVAHVRAPNLPAVVPMSDGHWTPWHDAADRVAALEDEIAAARAAIGAAWFLRPDDSIALALARKTTAQERLANVGIDPPDAPQPQPKFSHPQPDLSGVPTEYFEGEWRFPAADGAEPWAVVTYAETPCPETGHVGWCWWALGRMGEAQTYEDAKLKAETWIRARSNGMPPSGRQA